MYGAIITQVRSEERRVGKECRRKMWGDQAEDGIRDTSVTGVQTCALPILSAMVTAFGSFCPLPNCGSWRVSGVVLFSTKRMSWYASFRPNIELYHNHCGDVNVWSNYNSGGERTQYLTN